MCNVYVCVLQGIPSSPVQETNPPAQPPASGRTDAPPLPDGECPPPHPPSLWPPGGAGDQSRTRNPPPGAQRRSPGSGAQRRSPGSGAQRRSPGSSSGLLNPGSSSGLLLGRADGQTSGQTQRSEGALRVFHRTSASLRSDPRCVCVQGRTLWSSCGARPSSRTCGTPSSRTRHCCPPSCNSWAARTPSCYR